MIPRVIGELRPTVPASATVTTAAGVRCVAVRRPTVPLIELRIGIPFGSAAPDRALRELTASAVALGTAHLDRAGRAAAAALLGGEIHVQATADHLRVSAFALSANCAQIVELATGLLREPALPAGGVANEAEALASDAERRRAVLASAAHLRFAQALYGDHPYGEPIPDPARVRELGASDISAVMDAGLQSEGAYAVLVGDLELDAALEVATRALDDWKPSGERAERPGRSSPGLIRVRRPTATQTAIMVGSTIPGKADHATPALVVANALLGGGYASRITVNLRERHGYAYTPGSEIVHQRDASHLAVAASVSREVTAQALQEILIEIDRLRTQLAEPDEVHAAARMAAGWMTLELDTQAGIADRLAADAALGVPGQPGEYFRHLADRIQAVTPGEVRTVCERFFDPGALVTVLAGDWSAEA